jgi:hypothetical protein
MPSAALVIGTRELDLYAVDAVDTVNEQDQDEDKRDLDVLDLSPASMQCFPYLHAIL